MPKLPILRPGETVWRREHASRVAFLVDGESYYRAAALAVAEARRSVFLLGWDVHSGIHLLRGDDADRLPPALGPRFGALLAAHPGLEVFVLDWDFPLFFARDRESRSRSATQWPDSERFHFRYDSCHPAGASQHQKILLVDDSVVLCGGMDIGVGRWDSSRHLVRDERRSDPGFPDYVPAHDVMMMAAGDVAQAMGELVRERWRRAGGGEVAAIAALRAAAWPPRVASDLEDLKVGISRTLPPYDGAGGVFEIEALHLAAIAAAEKRIYIENQYLTSELALRALGRRLGEDDGPEVVIVLPQNNFGWMEARTIQVLHFRRIAELRSLDRHGRLRVCYPLVPDIGDKQVNLHSKVLIVDDRLLRIGSSNLTNRSMRLDSECDLSIESGGDLRIANAIAAFRARLLGEHLCLRPEEVEAALACSSMVALVDAKTAEDRCLRELHPDPSQLDQDIGDGTLIDPSDPITSETVIETFAPPPLRRRAKSRLPRVALLVLAAAALSACWRWTPLREWLHPATLAAWGRELRGNAAAPLVVLAAYLVSSLLVLPVTVLIVATTAVFGPGLGFAYACAGSLVSALAMFALGRMAGRGAVEQLTGRHYMKIARALSSRGLLTMIAIRLLPVAPFTIVNLVLGVTGVRARDFALGTVIGMTPGIAALSLFQTQLEQAVRRPGPDTLALLALVSLLLAGALLWLRGRLRVRRSGDPRQQASPASRAASGSSMSASSGR